LLDELGDWGGVDVWRFEGYDEGAAACRCGGEEVL